MGIPTGIQKLLKYIPSEEASRTCPVCGSQMTHYNDGNKSLSKCVQCGYSHAPIGSLSAQNQYDMAVNVTVLNSADKKAFFVTQQPLDEQLYNGLISHGRTPEEAKKEIIRDLNLEGDALEYFENKLDYLGVL